MSSWEYKDPGDTLERQFRDAGFDLRHPRIRKFFELCLAVQDLPRHLGQHSGGMVICQGQLDSIVPLEPATMPGRVVVQWDKEDCADMGIVKVDLLGLGMMAVLEDSITLIRNHYKEEVDLAKLPADDPTVYDTLQKADTVGMFQIESRAQMSCLPRLHPTHFYDIVVQVAIIRPGPIVGQMVNPYLMRRQGRQTGGLSASVAGAGAGAHAGRAAVSGATAARGHDCRRIQRRRGGRVAARLRLQAQREAHARHRGQAARGHEAQRHYRPRRRRRSLQSITSFALYGFPESHAASFALIAYASAYLKCHYLAAFTAALLNNQPMGFYSPATIVKDAQRHGLRVKPVDIGCSEWLCTLEAEESTTMWDERRGNGSRGSGLEGARLQPCRKGSGENAALAAEGTCISSVCKDPQWLKPSVVDGRVGTPEGVPLQSKRFAMRLGLRYAKGLREEAARAILRERSQRPFESIADLAYRVPELRRNELVLLASIGALNSIGVARTNRRSLAALGMTSTKRVVTAQLKLRPFKAACIAAMRCGRWSARRDLRGRCWRAFPKATAPHHWHA